MGQFTRWISLASRRRSANLIVDTNVFLEIYSIHDLLTAEENGNLSRVADRAERLRNALLFLYRCDKERLRCGVLLHETLRVLKARVPPDRDSLAKYYTANFLRRIGKTVFPSWSLGSLRDEDDRDLRAEQCDDLLLAVAQREDLPLITNEGHKQGSLRCKAQAAGVGVFAPGEFWRNGSIDPAEAGSAIMARFSRIHVVVPGESALDSERRRAALDLIGERWRAALEP